MVRDWLSGRRPHDRFPRYGYPVIAKSRLLGFAAHGCSPAAPISLPPSYAGVSVTSRLADRSHWYNNSCCMYCVNLVTSTFNGSGFNCCHLLTCIMGVQLLENACFRVGIFTTKTSFWSPWSWLNMLTTLVFVARYSLAITGINITFMSVQLLRSGHLKTHIYNTVQGAPTLADFHRVFCKWGTVL